MRIAAAVCAVLLALNCSVASAAEPKRWALCIGVNDYVSFTDLRFSARDAAGLADALRGAGFEERRTFLVHDAAADVAYRPSKANIERHLNAVLNLTGPDDLVIVSFSGHGMHFDGRSFLCPSEADDRRPAESMIDVADVYKRFESCPAALKLLIVDACRNDPRPPGRKSAAPADDRKALGQALARPPAGIMVLQSCAEDQISWEHDELKHGVFMHHVLKGLGGEADGNRNGRVTLGELYDYASDETKLFVANHFAGEVQIPALHGNIRGVFEFPRGGPRKAVAAFGASGFQAPSLDEVDARAEWQERPVVDSLKAMNAEWKRTKRVASIDEARALKNDSAAANAKILDAFGRPPESAEQVDYEATFTRVFGRDVHSTNPILMNSVEDGEVHALTSFGLFGFDWNLRPYAAAETVTSWQTSKDRLYDKVVLRDDCTWSDGLPITAHDVVFSLRTILDPRVPVPAVRGMAEELLGAAAYDERTLVFFHKRASPANVLKMAFPVIPKHVYEAGLDEDPTLRASEQHQKLENFPIVGGAYKITQRTPGKELVLQRRDDYFMHDGKQVRDKPYFATIRFRVIDDPARALDGLKAGEVDEVRLTPEQWLNETGDAEFDARATKVRGVEWVYFYFGWNLNHPSAPFFKELKVRQALGYAFDHETMLEKICHGLYEPSAGIFHADAKFAPRPMPAAYTQDVARAAKLLDEAGWKDRDGDGVREKRIDGKLVPLEFTIICSAIPQRVAICELLARNLKDVGIECRVQAMENGQLSNQLVRHDYQANFGGWGTGADPSTLKNIWKTGEGRNFNQYSNPKVDEILAEAEGEFDSEKRDALYAKIHELIYADQPVTFLYTQSSFYAFDKRLRGYRFSPRGPYAYGPGVGSFWKVREP